MFDHPKYICFRRGVFEDAVVFSTSVKHSDMAQLLGLSTEDIHSAGFVTFGSDHEGAIVPMPYGESVSLGVKTIKDESVRILKSALDMNDCF